MNCGSQLPGLLTRRLLPEFWTDDRFNTDEKLCSSICTYIYKYIHINILYILYYIIYIIYIISYYIFILLKKLYIIWIIYYLSSCSMFRLRQTAPFAIKPLSWWPKGHVVLGYYINNMLVLIYWDLSVLCWLISIFRWLQCN